MVGERRWRSKRTGLRVVCVSVDLNSKRGVWDEAFVL